MSYIFDALQRSEAERAGKYGAVMCGATELLRLAESQAVSQWRSEVRDEDLDLAQAKEQDRLFGLGELTGETEAPENSAAAVDTQQEDRQAILNGLRSIPISLPSDSRFVCFMDKESAAAEAFRLLGVRLRNLRRDRPMKKLLITSTVPREGKSMIAANLACTLGSDTRQNVLLIEGDVRRPSLTQLFGLTTTPGICDWLQDKSTIMTSIYRLDESGFWVLPAGHAPDNPLELIQSSRLQALMNQLNSWFDWIIIDSPPVLPLADASIWARLADGILIVARHGVTQKRQLQRGLDALDEKKLIGAIMNSTTSSSDSDYHYYRPSPDNTRSVNNRRH